MYSPLSAGTYPTKKIPESVGLFHQPFPPPLSAQNHGIAGELFTYQCYPHSQWPPRHFRVSLFSIRNFVLSHLLPDFSVCPPSVSIHYGYTEFDAA